MKRFKAESLSLPQTRKRTPKDAKSRKKRQNTENGAFMAVKNTLMTPKDAMSAPDNGAMMSLLANFGKIVLGNN
jgi:hypothetical protein